MTMDQLKLFQLISSISEKVLILDNVEGKNGVY